MRALMFALDDDRISGPVNFTGPAPVITPVFTTAFGRAFEPAPPMVVPGFALRALVGEFADEGLLSGQRAIPAVWKHTIRSTTSTIRWGHWPT